MAHVMPAWERKFLKVFSWTVLVGAGLGFTFKLMDFLFSVIRGDVERAFIIPVVTYLSVAVGWFLVFLWTLVRGHYRDVEAPKYEMLEQERRLDEATRDWWYTRWPETQYDTEDPR